MAMHATKTNPEKQAKDNNITSIVKLPFCKSSYHDSMPPKINMHINDLNAMEITISKKHGSMFYKICISDITNLSGLFEFNTVTST